MLIQLIIHDIFRLSLTILRDRELEKVISFSILSFFLKAILILEHDTIFIRRFFYHLLNVIKIRIYNVLVIVPFYAYLYKQCKEFGII